MVGNQDMILLWLLDQIASGDIVARNILVEGMLPIIRRAQRAHDSEVTSNVQFAILQAIQKFATKRTGPPQAVFNYAKRAARRAAHVALTARDKEWAMQDARVVEGEGGLPDDDLPDLRGNSNQVLLHDILSCAKTPLEQVIVILKSEGRTSAQVARMLAIDQPRVCEALRQVRMRWNGAS